MSGKPLRAQKNGCSLFCFYLIRCTAVRFWCSPPKSEYQILHIKGSFLYKTAVTSHTSSRPPRPPEFLTNWPPIQEVPTVPLRFDNWLEWSTELTESAKLRITVLSWGIHTGKDLGGSGMQGFHALCLWSRGAAPTLQSGSFSELWRPEFLSRFHYIGIIDYTIGHVNKLNIQSRSPPERSGTWKPQLCNHIVGFSGDQPSS